MQSDQDLDALLHDLASGDSTKRRAHDAIVALRAEAERRDDRLIEMALQINRLSRELREAQGKF